MPDGSATDLMSGQMLRRAEERARNTYQGMRGEVVPAAHVQAALDYLLLTAGLIESAHLRLRRAQRATRRAYAAALLAAPAGVCRNREEREAWAENCETHQRALDEEIEADAAMRGHYARRETAKTMIEAWQTASANIRANRL